MYFHKTNLTEFEDDVKLLSLLNKVVIYDDRATELILGLF